MGRPQAISYIYSGQEDRLLTELKAGVITCDDCILNLCLSNDMIRAAEYMARKFTPAKSVFAVIVSKEAFSDEIIEEILIKNPTWNTFDCLMTVSYLPHLRRFKRICALDDYKNATNENFIQMLINAKRLEVLRAIEEQDPDMFWIGLANAFDKLGLFDQKDDTILLRKGVVKILKDFATTTRLQEQVSIFCSLNQSLKEVFEKV